MMSNRMFNEMINGMGKFPGNFDRKVNWSSDGKFKWELWWEMDFFFKSPIHEEISSQNYIYIITVFLVSVTACAIGMYTMDFSKFQ